MSNKDFTLEDGMWRGDFEWETTDKKRVVFKRNPNGKFIVLPHEPATDQPQKEWDILAFRNKTNILNYSPTDGCYHYNYGSSEHYCYHPETALRELTIYSVRRLSDVEVFTVGSSFSNDHCGIYTQHTIKEFVVSGNELQVWPEDGGYYPLFSIKKIPAKTPLFTTEDGKPVYEGDEFYCIDGGWGIRKTQLPHYKLIFSTESAAREYRLMNKPCLSLSDLLSVWGNAYRPETSPMFNDFKELAKTKINQ